MSYFCKCPRCGSSALEHLKTYSHCVECLYFQDYWKSTESNLSEADKTLAELNLTINPKPALLSTIESDPFLETLEAIGA